MQTQNGHQVRPQHQPHQPTQPSFYDPSAYLNADDSSLAKQTSGLNVPRIPTNGRSVPPNPSSANPSYLSTVPSANQIARIANGGQHMNSIPGHLNASQNMSAQQANSFVDSSHIQSTRPTSQPPTSLKQRQRNFLVGLSNVMTSLGTPLPPGLTGVPYPPNYDPSTSPWKIIEPSPTELGSFRLAGKDVDLFKLWGLVIQAGGSAKLNSQQGSWSRLLPHFDLPEQSLVPQSNGHTSVAHALSQYYMVLLNPFEEAYKRNIQEQQRRALLSASRQQVTQSQQPPSTVSTPGRPPQPLNGNQSNPSEQTQGETPPNINGPMGQPMTSGPSLNITPPYQQPPHQSPIRPPADSTTGSQQLASGSNHTSASLSDTLSSSSQMVNGALPQTLDKDILDADVQGIKRKLDHDEADSKRARQKIGSEPPEAAAPIATSTVDRSTASSTQPSNGPAPPQPPVRRAQPTRRKIEYIPLGREVDTYGGRDLTEYDEEAIRLRERRALRDINEWGNVDIEALTMSLRSRLTIELSYALTTFTLLSTMKGQTPGSGFPIFQCADLLDEVLDLLEDEAFDGVEEHSEPDLVDDFRITTHRELVNTIQEEESHLFAGLARRRGSKDPDPGPHQRSGNLILTVTNIIRNLSTIPDNVAFIAHHERLLDIMLRLCCATHDGCKPCAVSPVLSLGDLVNVRKDALYTLINLVANMQFNTSSSPSARMTRVARRAFDLVASYLVDPTECISPLAHVQQNGFFISHNLKPPLLPDIALEVFTRLSHTDSNRQIFSQLLPQNAIWRLFEALIHRLPILDADFQIVTREYWLSYVEKLVMAIYSLAFLAPPKLKERFKTDRKLGFAKVMLRMVQKFLTNPSPEGRLWFSVCARRAVETMKVVDDGQDSFDTSQTTTLPTIAFGMGYGEVGENEKEKGTGLLGGHRDVTWELLMPREVDDVMFSELESLTRVD